MGDGEKVGGRSCRRKKKGTGVGKRRGREAHRQKRERREEEGKKENEERKHKTKARARRRGKEGKKGDLKSAPLSDEARNVTEEGEWQGGERKKRRRS